MAVDKSQGPLLEALIETAVLGSKEDHRVLLQEINNHLAVLSQRVGALESASGSSTATTSSSTGT